jgi:serine/threonine protein kinase
VDIRPGLVLGEKFELRAPLGQGGMGVVWAARHLGLDTDVAVKILRPERLAERPALFARFEREARTTARIKHPHVVEVMDYGTVDGQVPYLVMELLEGFTLAELLERGGRLSFATARSLVEQVGSALACAHGHGVVHRDVKPANILVTEGNRDRPLFVKVLDFGVAKMLDAEAPGASATLTETGVVIGSAPYMSPEQLEGSAEVDLRTDLWSLGIVAYEALTGVLPFQGGSFVTVGAAVLRGTYRPASSVAPNLPRAIDAWFAKALSVDPEGRFASADEMVDAFLSLDDELPSSSTPATEPRETRRTELAPAVDGDGAGTASHRPAALRPDRASPPATVDLGHAPSRRPRARIWGIAGAAIALAGAGAIALPTPTSGARSCPPGMVLVPGGSFRMGSDANGETPSDETPSHMEKVAAFCLDVTEVTVRAYASCTSCGSAPRTVELEGVTPNARAFESQLCNGPGAEDHPINCVDWQQAGTYCSSVGKRLPHEREWELAARGVEGRIHPWGDASPSRDRLNACGAECSAMLTERRRTIGKEPWPALHGEDDGAPATAPVGSHPAGATALGILDLAGNVWEWTDTPYCPYERPECGDSRRVLRGGGWDTVEPHDVQASRRFPAAPTARGRSIGFRCAKTP